jgi:hypothetical protein
MDRIQHGTADAASGNGPLLAACQAAWKSSELQVSQAGSHCDSVTGGFSECLFRIYCNLRTKPAVLAS